MVSADTETSISSSRPPPHTAEAEGKGLGFEPAAGGRNASPDSDRPAPPSDPAVRMPGSGWASPPELDRATFASSPAGGPVAEDKVGRRTSGSQCGPPTPSSSAAAAAALEQQPTWNHPRSNIFRLGAAFWAFIIMGANDAAYGAILPYLQDYYRLNYLVASLIFLAPAAGYIAAALVNEFLHMRLGQRGVAVISTGSYLAAYVVVALHPPFTVLVVAFLVSGFGRGLCDGAWNAFVGSLARADELLGLLHGFFGLGCVAAPLIATFMIAKGGLQWYTFYYLMVGMSALALVLLTAAFRHNTGAQYREQMTAAVEAAVAAEAKAKPATASLLAVPAAVAATEPRAETNQAAAAPTTTGHSLGRILLKRPSARVVWTLAGFLFGYSGTEVATGGWIVKFALEVRHAGSFASGMTETGYWLGQVFGRVVLGFATPRIGERVAITAYLLLSIGFQLVVWLVPDFYATAIAIALVGFFQGPLFPSAVVAATKRLPRHFHVSAIGFVASIAQTGTAIVPFAVGAIAQSRGVQVLQPVALAGFAWMLVLWLSLPRVGRVKGGEGKGGRGKMEEIGSGA